MMTDRKPVRAKMPLSIARVESFERRTLLSAVLTDLADFSTTVGGSAFGGITRDAQGNLFGTTRSGGQYGDGSVFEIPQGSATISRLISFNGTNGNSPAGNLFLDANGNLYGTTILGGANNSGTLFKIAAGTTTLITLASFSSATNGANPAGDLVVDFAGNIFGTTAVGGNGAGTIFKYTAATNTLATLAIFTNSSGRYPFGLTADASGNLFGVTQNGGNYGIGNIFEVKSGTNTILQLASFDTTSGPYPTGDLTIDANGNLYGTTAGPGFGFAGVIFELHSGSSNISRLAAFSTAGNEPVGDIVFDSSGNLYGVTTAGGTYGDGMVYELTAGSTIIAPVTSFNGTNGKGPLSGLTMDANGNLFGTTALGGANNVGDVFEITGRPATTHITVITQPSSSVPAGTPQTLTADLLLDSGTIDVSNNSPVSVQLVYGPNGGSVTFNSNITAVNGVVTVPNLTFTTAGTYILQINSPSLTSGSPASVSINVVPAVATKLVAISQPFAPVPVGSLGDYKIAVEDSYGNIVTSDNSTMSVTTADATVIGGTQTVAVNNGVADFADLTSYVSGNRNLIFTDGNLIPTQSYIVSIVAGAPVKLAFTQEPQNTAAGGSIGAVVVTVEDAYGNPVLTNNSTVTLTSDDPTATVGISAPTMKGVALFNTISSDIAGLHHLVATDGIFSPISSTPWMTFASAASRLKITDQPTSANFGQTLGPITVEIIDAFGNLVTTDNSAITLSGTDLAGSTTITAQDGVAVFSNLTINTNGNQVLTAGDSQLPSTQSAAITINDSAVSGGYLPPITVDPSAIFPTSKTAAKSLKLELVNIATGKIVSTRTNYPKPGHLVVVNNLGSNTAGNYNVVALDSLGHTAILEQVTVLPSAPHELYFSETPAILNLGSIVQVTVLDKSGNSTTAADGSIITLHSWLPKGTPGAAPILTGNVTAVVMNGVATFTGLLMDQAGRAHLIAHLGDLKATVSGVFQPDTSISAG